MAGSSLPERVAQIYYTYGLFCSSYPITAIGLALSVVLLCCYPLLNVPLPGNIPTVVTLPLHGKTDQQNKADCIKSTCTSTDSQLHLNHLFNETQKLPYLWAKDNPLLYVHQIVMKIGVAPWNSNLKMWDAFRAPLQEVFRILETVRNHEDPETKSTLSQLCYQIEDIKRRDPKANLEVLPEYSCLILSPANLWHQNMQSFSLDNNLVNTVYSFQKGKSSIAEMAFGMQLRDSGVKRYPLRARPRVIQYAITIFYQSAEGKFINSLTKKLRDMYPLYKNSTYPQVEEVTVIYYPGQFNFHELIQLLITFLGLFLYVYFSVRKIEFIKSKLGLAACAVVTVAGSLSMSFGICFYFGFSLSLQGKEIFPYLLIIVGLENILVLTKSVTSTDSRLDVKIRLAQGLSKEGWSITQNILTEITILTVSFFTFVPFIQEFSIFMIISLLTDFFVQMVFFAPILGIDVRRMECFQDRDKLHLKEYFNANDALNWRYNKSYVEENVTPQRMTKSKSHPRLNGLAQNSPTDVLAKRSSISSQDHVPKRIRLVNMWARTRFFQRAFMVWMLVWISMIVYNSGVADYFLSNIDKSGSKEVKKNPEKQQSHSNKVSYVFQQTNQIIFSPITEMIKDNSLTDANDTILFKHSRHSRPWTRLSPYHWSSILGQYNLSVGGKYIAVLPPTLLSHRVTPERAVSLRGVDEKEPPPLRWQALAAALDPIHLLPDFDIMDSKSQSNQWGKASELPIYPTTPMEILLLAILCTISVAVIAYMMVVLYRCVCSRNYAEWRASWSEDEEYRKIIAKQPAVQLVMEAVPLVVAGHSQEVECLVTDGEKIVSSCLQGNIKVWDSQNGEIITNIDRGAFFKLQMELYDKVNSKKISNSNKVVAGQANSELGDKPATNIHRLRKNLNNHLSGLRFRFNSRNTPLQMPTAETVKNEFAKTYRNLYCTDGDNVDVELKEVQNDQETNVKSCDKNVCKNSKIAAVNSLETRNKCNGSVHKEHINDKIEEIAPTNISWRGRAINESPIWCMDFSNDLIVLGCADGRLEFWEASSGKLLCVWWRTESEMCSKPAGVAAASAVTQVRVMGGGRRLCAASLAGRLTLLKLDVYDAAAGTHVDWHFSTAHRRTHKRTGSAGSLRRETINDTSKLTNQGYDTGFQDGDEVVCVRLAQCRPHQQPITEMHSDGGRILTGGQDHILKVFSSSDLSLLFTLHGHCGPISSCFIDHANPTIAGSGSQDGLLCVWDLHTGACLYSIQAHDGSVTALTYTASYVVSAGADERLCIFDRFQGHMLNSIHIGLNYMSRMLPLTHTMLLMGDRGGLKAYDLSSGDVIRRVILGESDGCVFVRQILPLKDAIVCDYANQLRIVRFPLVSRLSDMKTE